MSKSRLRALRYLAGKSQEELSFLTKISQTKISRAERNVYEFAPEEKQKIAEILAGALDKNPEDIFEGEN